MQINQTYTDLAPAIYRYAYSRLRNAADAEDIVSETFTRLLSNSKTQRISSNELKAWAFGIARNVVLEHYKKSGKEFTIPVYEHSETNGEIEVPSLDKQTEDMAIDSILFTQVQAALATLDEFTQEVIVLHVWEHLSYVEIALITGQSEDMVRKRFNRGIQKLQNILNTEEKSKKLKAVALPIIIAGLAQLAKGQGYQMSSTFSNNLFINLRNVPEGHPISLFAKLKLFLASKWGIALLCFLGISAVALIALIVALVSNRPGGNGNGNTSSSATSTATSYPSSVTASMSSPTTSADPYASWLIYENQDFSLRYPNDWAKQEVTESVDGGFGRGATFNKGPISISVGFGVNPVTGWVASTYAIPFNFTLEGQPYTKGITQIKDCDGSNCVNSTTPFPLSEVRQLVSYFELDRYSIPADGRTAKVEVWIISQLANISAGPNAPHFSDAESQRIQDDTLNTGKMILESFTWKH